MRKQIWKKDEESRCGWVLFSFMKIVAMKVEWHHFFGVKKNKNLKEDGVRF